MEELMIWALSGATALLIFLAIVGPITAYIHGRW